MLEYVAGDVAHDLPALDLDGLFRVGRLIRSLHDLTQGYAPPPWARWNVVLLPDREDLVCHHDLAPWNLVITPDRWVLIDWDNAGPSSREWEIAYAAHGFVGLADGNDPTDDAPRLAALVDGYGLDLAAREHLCDVLSGPVRAMWRRPRPRWRDRERPLGLPPRRRPRGTLGSGGRLHRPPPDRVAAGAPGSRGIARTTSAGGRAAGPAGSLAL